MVQYNESTVTGTKYQRAFRVEMENPLNDVPKCTFHEESVVILDTGTTITTPVGNVSKLMTDSTVVFPIINPTDFQPTGATMTYGDVYAIMVSLYLQFCAERDTQV